MKHQALLAGVDEEHVKRISALTDAERAGVADFLSRLSPGLTSVPTP